MLPTTESSAMGSAARVSVSRGLGDRFVKLWTSNACSNLADGIVMVALPLLAVQLTQSPSLVAGVTVAVHLPWLLFTLHLGAIADRADRKRMMHYAHLARVVLLLALAAAVAADAASMWLLYGVTLAVGVSEVGFTVARGPSLPLIVQRDQLVAANSRLEATETTLNEFVGPPLGGLLVGIGAAAALAASSVAYLVAALAILAIRGSLRTGTGTVRGQTLTADIKDGLCYLRQHQLIRTLTLMGAVMAGGWAAWMSIFVLHVRGPMGLSEFGYGILLSVMAAGGVTGALTAGSLQRRIGRNRLLLGDVLGTAVLVGTPALTGNRWLVGAALCIGGATGVMWTVTARSLTQTLVPDRLLGRVSAAIRVASWGMLPVGAALGGLIGETLGLRAVFAGAALAVLSLLLFGRRIADPVIDRYLDTELPQGEHRRRSADAR